MLQFELLDALMRGIPSSSGASASGAAAGDASAVGNTNATNNGVSNSNEDRFDEDNVLSISASNANAADGTNANASSAIFFQPNEVLTYISLLSTFQPSSLCSYIQTHDNYPLDETLQITRSKNIFDALVFLLDRTGDTAAALDLCLNEIGSVVLKLSKEIETILKQNISSNAKSLMNVTSTATSLNDGSGNNTKTALDVSKLLLIINNSNNNISSTAFAPTLSSGDGNGFDRVDKMEIMKQLETFRLLQSCIQITTNVCSKCNQMTYWFTVLDSLLKEKCKYAYICICYIEYNTITQ